MTKMPGFTAEAVLNIPKGSYTGVIREVSTSGINPSFNFCDLLSGRARQMCHMGGSLIGTE